MVLVKKLLSSWWRSQKNCLVHDGAHKKNHQFMMALTKKPISSWWRPQKKVLVHDGAQWKLFLRQNGAASGSRHDEPREKKWKNARRAEGAPKCPLGIEKKYTFFLAKVVYRPWTTASSHPNGWPVYIRLSVLLPYMKPGQNIIVIKAVLSNE